MKIDLRRDARHDESCNKFVANKGVGCIYACPRFGKTTIGKKLITRNRLKQPNSKIVILTPSEIVEKHWRNYVDDVIIMTSNKAKNNLANLLKEDIDFLIVDELHKFVSDDNVNLLKSITTVSKYRLALTGTYPNNKTLTALFPIVDTITEEEAIANGWISEYIEYNVPIELNDNEKVKYIKYSEFITETLELFKGKSKLLNGKTQLVKDDFDLIMSCYTGIRPKNNNIKYIHGDIIRQALATIMGWNKDLDLSNSYNRERDLYWSPSNIYERCKQFKQFMSSRNEILINNSNKLNAIVDIIRMNDVPTIIFNESTEFVNKVADRLGILAIPYHSNIKSRPMLDENNNIIRSKNGKPKMFGATRLKRMAIEGMQSGRYKYLVTAKALDEGLDLPILEQVIITGGSENPIQQLQRSARGKTLDNNNKNKFTRIFNLYVDDFNDIIGINVKSRDKAKLINRQSKYTHSVKWINKLSDLTI